MGVDVFERSAVLLILGSAIGDSFVGCISKAAVVGVSFYMYNFLHTVDNLCNV